MKTMLQPLSAIARFALLLLVLAALPGAAAPTLTTRGIVSTNGDPILYPSYLTVYNGVLYFRANNLLHGNNVELWGFDGSVARMMADINPGSSGSDPAYLAGYNNRLYFAAHGSSGGTKLWVYDPATSLASLAPGSASQASNPEELFAYGANLYFRAFRSNIGVELWKFDGANQTPIDIFPNGSSYPQHFILFNGLMYFNACGTPGQGTELWRYNGTTWAEAARIYPNNGSSPEQFGIYNNQLFFSAYDGVHGRELWQYSAGAASMAVDLVPGGQYASSNPSGLTEYKGKLYFNATDGTNGYELWSYDGTEARMVAEINPTPNPGNGDDWMMDSSPGGFTIFDGVLYFSANDGTHGRELWSYDGTNVQLVLDINPGVYGSEVAELTVYNNTLYFTADDGYNPTLRALEPKVLALAPAPRPLSFDMQQTRVVGQTMQLCWQTVLGLRYQVQYKDNLSNGSWQALGDAQEATGTSLTVSDDLTAAGRRFYRVVLVE